MKKIQKCRPPFVLKTLKPLLKDLQNYDELLGAQRKRDRELLKLLNPLMSEVSKYKDLGEIPDAIRDDIIIKLEGIFKNMTENPQLTHEQIRTLKPEDVTCGPVVKEKLDALKEMFNGLINRKLEQNRHRKRVEKKPQVDPKHHDTSKDKGASLEAIKNQLDKVEQDYKDHSKVYKPPSTSSSIGGDAIKHSNRHLDKSHNNLPESNVINNKYAVSLNYTGKRHDHIGDDEFKDDATIEKSIRNIED